MDASQEFLKALELVAQADAERAAKSQKKEFRIYYDHSTGMIMSFHENDFPESGHYIVIQDTGQFHRHNTHLLRVRDGKLIELKSDIDQTFALQKSQTGQPVVCGHAALALTPEDNYVNIEYYDYRNR